MPSQSALSAAVKYSGTSWKMQNACLSPWSGYTLDSNVKPAARVLISASKLFPPRSSTIATAIIPPGGRPVPGHGAEPPSAARHSRENGSDCPGPLRFSRRCAAAEARSSFRRSGSTGFSR